MEQILPTTCPMDCPDTCSLNVTVRDDEVIKIASRTQGNPITTGFICSKVAKFNRRVTHKKRLTKPLRRIGPKGSGQFEVTSWSSAISEIADRFSQCRANFGGESILPYHYGGSNGFLTDDFLDAVFFSRLGASRLDKTICAVPTSMVSADMYGKMPGVAFQDYPHAQLIVIWGANPKASNIHLVPYLKQARKNGAFIMVVDPINHFSDREIDLHVPIQPGADAPFALALINHWRQSGKIKQSFLDQWTEGQDQLWQASESWSVADACAVSGVSRDVFEQVSEVMTKLSPAVLRCGWGLERNRYGGVGVASVLAIPAVLGWFGQKAGGYTMSNSGATPFNFEAVVGPIDKRPRLLNMTQLARHLNGPLDPPIKALYVYNANPVATVPDQRGIIRGLARDDLFTVVHEQVQTDTADWADIVLPATTFLEQWDIRRAYGAYVIGGVKPVITPRGEARCNNDVFAALAKAMSFDDPCFSWSEKQRMEAIISGVQLPEGQELDPDLMHGGQMQSILFNEKTPTQFVDQFPRTANQKINLFPACLGPSGYQWQAPKKKNGQLSMITPASGKLISSTMGELHLKRLEVSIHTRDAGERGIEHGDAVKVWNELGEVHCYARVHNRVSVGVVSMPKGAWLASSLNGSTSTALCPDDVGNTGGNACFNDARVWLELSQEPKQDPTDL